MVNDPSLISTAGTPEELIAVADALADFSDQLDDYIKSLPNLFAPAVLQLRHIDTQIASDSAVISRLAVELMAQEVRAALVSLQGQINSAKETLREITNVKLALSVASAVLTVAANVSTGNPLGTASSVISLVKTLTEALNALNTSP